MTLLSFFLSTTAIDETPRQEFPKSLISKNLQRSLQTGPFPNPFKQ